MGRGDQTAEPGKETLRASLSAKRAGLPAARAAEAGRRAQRRVLALPELSAAGTVGCYLAVGREVGTDLILGRCWREGRQVCVPAFREDGAGYGFSVLPRGALVRRGPHGIPEPVGRGWVRVEDLEAVLVPGLAFDGAGRRLGRGGGHYDALLGSGRLGGPAIGLAFDFQIVPRVPVAAGDVAMSMVVTENRVIRSAPCAE